MGYVLGVSAYYHDAAAALVRDGEIIAAAQEERFTRKKNDASFPVNAVRYCLNEAKTSIEEIEAVIFYDKPFLTFERLLETYLSFAPRGFKLFLMSAPVWLKEKIFLKGLLKREIKRAFPGKSMPQILFSEHHLSHAGSAFFPSPFDEAAILTMDGVGEWATAGIFHGKGNEITCLKEMHFPHSWGLYYSAFTQFLGFKVNSGEYKLMGLAPYGDPDSPQTRRFCELIERELIQMPEDGSLRLNMKYFSFATSNKMIPLKRWETLFGIKARVPESELQSEQANLAWAAQNILEKGLVGAATEAKRLTGSKSLVMAGGVALNCVANAKIRSAGIFEQVWVQPAADDAGGALGAALAYSHIGMGKSRKPQTPDSMKGSFLGPDYSDSEIEAALNRRKVTFQRFESDQALCETVAQLLAQGQIVGWHQGRLEWGPRALGNRSILGAPDRPDMQKKLNLRVKFRESFRPFAPVVMAEHASEYFEFEGRSPYMLFTAPVKTKLLKDQPADFVTWSIGDKLSFLRSDLPAITHVDNSARLQTVHKEANPLFWLLLESYRRLSGLPVLVNTSFNVRGEPIVCTPNDSLNCFLLTDIDAVAIGRYLVQKSSLSTDRLQELRHSLRKERHLEELD